MATAESLAPSGSASVDVAQVVLPRVAITYCTQCRWMLRAAYFAQELLSTFGTSIGEIALIPATGGKFTVTLDCVPQATGSGAGNGEEAQLRAQNVLIWDRKAEGGFPGECILGQHMSSISASLRGYGFHLSECIERHYLFSLSLLAETKVLKQRVRDHIEPAKDLGHSDKHGKQGSKKQESADDDAKQKMADQSAEIVQQEVERVAEENGVKLNDDGTVCEDCR